MSPESIPRAPPLGSGVRVRSRTGGLVQQQCSGTPLKNHHVLYSPYFQDLGFFFLMGVSKNPWTEQTRVGRRRSVETLPHTWRNNPGSPARAQNQPSGCEGCQWGTGRGLSPGKSEKPDWLAVGAQGQMGFSTSGEELRRRV